MLLLNILNYQLNGFIENSFLSTNEYFYDLNGNLTKDLNKQIDNIDYNYLNLPQHISMIPDANNAIDYLYSAYGVKLQKSKTINGDQGYLTHYLGSIVYTNETPDYIITPEGRAVANQNGGFDYEYSLTDHLGNTRISFNQSGEILQDNSYYPFGMSMGESLSFISNISTENKYKYNGKEMQDDFGLDWYDYGARFYDATLGRWHVVDPMADTYFDLSPYSYVANNPLIFIDPDGMLIDDYTLNKNTGEVKLVKETDDTHDRVLETNRKGEVKHNNKGEAKVAIDKVEKGILKDGQNFKNEDQVISVGGKDQPSTEGVKSFTLNLSEYVGTEIKGFSYSSNGSGDVSDMVLGKYKNNSYTESYGSPTALAKKYRSNFSLNNIVQNFHTHPEGKLGSTKAAPQQSTDVRNLQKDKPLIPNASFIILYRIKGQKQPAEYDYTHEYKP